MPGITALLRVWFAVVLIFSPLVARALESAATTLPDLSATNAIAPLATQAIRISQVYGGGDVGGTYPCDFVELFNSSAQEVSLAGWSVQYATSGGTIWGIKTLSDRIIGGYSYLLVDGVCSGAPPLIPDVEWGRAIDHVNGKVAVASKTTAITGKSDPALVDLVGYGVASLFEGSGRAPALSANLAALRGGGGCTDTDDNAADFTATVAAPRNSGSPTHPCIEAAPTVESAAPGDGAVDIARDANMTITFSEPVTPGTDWFQVTCELSAAVTPATATVSGGPESFTINPNVDFYADDACRLTIRADAVSDNDTNDPPDTLEASYSITFQTVPGQCGEPASPIHRIQGTGASSPAVGLQRTIEAAVTGDFQGADGLSGYFLQEEASDADADALTSEGIFVYEHLGSLAEVSTGDHVRVTGAVGEVDGMTALTEPTRVLACGVGAATEAAELTLPLNSTDEWERYEGMLVQFAEPMTVADSAELDSKGRLTLVLGPVPQYYTQQHPPGAAGYAGWENDLALRTIVLDDASERAYPDPIRYPPEGLSAANTVRAGDVVEARLTGIVDGRGAQAVIQPSTSVAFIRQNRPSAAPARVNGNVRVVFLSLNDYFNVTSGFGGERGASSPEEFGRQCAKLIPALIALNPDVIAVSKLENDGFGPGTAIANLVGELNAAGGSATYAYVDPGLTGWGADAVSVGIVYRTSVVAPIGQPARLETGAFDQRPDTRNHRAPMAQTFREPVHGERFTVVVNEWRGRTGCPASGPDMDAGDGQGCWNASRAAAAQDLAAWMALDPTGSNDPDFLLLGELNTLRLEDPMQQLAATGYTDLIARDVGSDTITALAGARAGYTDHALASASLAPQIVDTAVWAINAEEPAALDYQMENKTTAQLASLYAADPYRSSDQNPIAVDLKLQANPLAVDLASFESQVEGRRIVLTWETSSEQDVAGFEFHRARSVEGPWELVNPTLIPAKAPGAAVGASYQYDDEPGGNGIWLHRLTAVDMAGEREILGLVQSKLELPTALQLAGFRATPRLPWTILALAVGALAGLLSLVRRR